MNDNNEYLDELEEDVIQIDFKAIWEKLKSSWKTILLWTGCAAVLGVVIGFSIPREYKVTSKLAPELSATATNRLTSLTSLLSMSSNMMGTTDAVYPMVYPDIVGSVPFITSLFDVPVKVKDGKEEIETTVYDYVINYTRGPWWNEVLALPFKALGWFMNLFRPEGAEPDNTVVDTFNLTPEQHAVYKALSKSIIAEIDKKTMVITMTVKAQSPSVAATLAKEVNNALKRTVTSYRTEKSKDDLVYYQKMFDEAKADYYKAQSAYARYEDSHQSVVLKSAQSETERLRNEMNLKFQLYNSVSQQLQSAHAKVQQETPVFFEIIPPTTPARPYKPSKVKILAVFMLLGFCAGAAKVLVSKK